VSRFALCCRPPIAVSSARCVKKVERPPEGPLVRRDLLVEDLALTGTRFLGVLCLANRPAPALDQLGRVVFAGQVLRLNVLVEEDVGVCETAYSRSPAASRTSALSRNT
jgi:hypothetical protein